MEVNLSTNAVSNEIDWLESIKEYDYSNFKDIQLIGRDLFRSVVRANWKNSKNNVVILKTFNDDNQVINEVMLCF
jgi:hypothetical protein